MKKQLLMLQEAKKLFLSYCGSYYEMDRDGVLEKYLSFSVNKDIEKEWGNIKCDELLNKTRIQPVVNDDFDCLLTLIKSVKLLDKLDKLMDLILDSLPKLDTFTKIRISEEILELLNKVENKEIVYKGIYLLNELLCSLTSEKITVNIFYKKKIYLADLLDEDKIRERITIVSRKIIDFLKKY